MRFLRPCRGRVLMALAVILPAGPGAFAGDVTGLWLTDDGEGVVEITPCGELLCGRIVWLKEPYDEKGQPIRDVNNPTPAERDRLLCGAQIIQDLKHQDDDSWDGGYVYDPEEGKSYRVMLKAAGDDRLEVRGYIGIKSIGETRIWTRGAHGLHRCVPETALGPVR